MKEWCIVICKLINSFNLGGEMGFLNHFYLLLNLLAVGNVQWRELSGKYHGKELSWLSTFSYFQDSCKAPYIIMEALFQYSLSWLIIDVLINLDPCEF